MNMIKKMTALLFGTPDIKFEKEFKANQKSEVEIRVDMANASRSQAVMNTERGAQPQHRKARMFDRYLTKSRKRANSYGNCNNAAHMARLNMGGA